MRLPLHALPTHLVIKVLSYADCSSAIAPLFKCSRELWALRDDEDLQAQWLVQHHPTDMLLRAARAGREGVLLRLLQLPAARSLLQAMDGEGRTVMHCSAAAGLAGAVGALLKMGMDADQATAEDGLTPLHFAAAANRASVVRVLVAAGADAGVVDLANRNALHTACARGAGHAEVVRALLQAHDSARLITTNNDYDETPLCLARRQGHRQCCELMVLHLARHELSQVALPHASSLL